MNSSLPTANCQLPTILVTGGAGFIGSNLVDALIEDGREVAVVDDLSTGLKENVNPKAKFFKADICSYPDLKSIFNEFRPEAVYHLAAQASVVKSVEDPKKDIQVNVIGTINLIRLALESEVKKFIFSSTGGAIYGDGAPRPTPESAKEEPASPYGLDKLLAEKYLDYFKKLGNIQTLILRYANVFGPRQNPHGEAGVIAIFTAKMLRGEPVEVWGDGEQIRDYVYVGDVIRANLEALKFNGSGIYNIGTGVETSVNHLAEMLSRATGSKSEIKHTEPKESEQRASSLNTQKIYQDFGWKPEVDLEGGIKRTIEWFNRNLKIKD